MQFFQGKRMSVVRVTKIAAILFGSALLASCASLKFINPFAEIKVEDTEPRVTFVDSTTTKVEKSELPSISPELVIASYRRLLERGDPVIRMEALRRLADLTMRLAETKLAVDDPALLAGLKPAVRDATFEEAVRLYETLLRDYPNYPRMEDVKYQLARAHSLNSEPEKSLALLDQIAVSPVKASSYVESQFRRGESYFVRKKYAISEQAYSEVLLKGKDTTFYDKALYKRGWSLFKQSLFPESQKDFFELLERLYKQRIQMKKVTSLSEDLINDTKRVISLAFYNQDGALSIQKHFEESGRKPYEDEIYDSLAQLYIDQERFQDASETYLGYIRRNPLSESSPDFHSRVINIYKKGGFPSLILPEKENYIVSYGRRSQFWKVHLGTVTEAIKPQLREHLNDISKFYHANAQKSKKPADYIVAAKWYKEILDTFEEPQIDSEYRFLLAEVLSEGQRYKDAASEFETVAYLNPKSKYSRDAGYRALVAYQSVTYPKDATLKVKLSAVIASGLKFAEFFPLDKETAGILARVAEQYLSIGDIGGAIATSRQLLTMAVPPTATQNNRARIIIANGLFDLRQYKEAEQAITQLFVDVKLNKKQLATFHNRRAEAIYQQADAAKTAGLLPEAIALFLKVGLLEAKSAVAVNAHFDAATLLLKTKSFVKAADLFESFRSKYPKNPLSAGIPERLALIYEEQKNWTMAAKEYQVLATNNSDPELARERFWHVAELYLKAEDKVKAIAAYKKYVWAYPQPYLLAQEARQKLVELYTDSRENDKVTFWRQKIVQFYTKGANDNNARTRFLAAQSKYILSEPLFTKYGSIKLKLPLGKSLKKKKQAMNKALKAYELIATYQVGQYTSASTHKIAQIYQILAEDLMASQRPKGLSEDELEEYGFLLEDQAVPFEDKAINLFEINASRTKDNIYNQAVRDSIKELIKLKPAQYDKNERMEDIENVNF
jgi:tetratricopeptide (TPR) repeat protein